ncbi:MAG: aminotransferase class V-fold PLP-dependent enzyme [Myxococcota bacterium]
MSRATLPPKGIERETLFAAMRERKRQDADWRGARTWSLCYPAGEDVDSVLAEANQLYLYENALNPFRFPSVRQMEVDVVGIALSLLNAPEQANGCMTSGGTESILMAMKTARERARAERGVEHPTIVAPYSAHPAFAKAASYLRMELVAIPLRDDLRADVAAAAKLVDDRTAVVVGSAPCYPFGVVDPIPELAALASDRGASFHTDACLGGFLWPFWEALGETVPPFDFRVDGVTTISADVHKYGYATKGASTISHRDGDHLLRHQLFAFRDWPGGGYASFAMAGARPAAPIAAAWAILHWLGRDGYVRLARKIRDTTRKLRAGIAAIDGLFVHGDPEMSLFAFGSTRHDLFAIADVMDDRGWCLDRQTGPDALHLMVSPEHERVADAFLADLREAVETHGSSRGREARYS